MLVIDFKQIDSVNGLSKSFGFHPEVLEGVINSSDQKKYYSVIKIPKKNNKQRFKYRTVYKASEHLAILHKNILLHLDHTIINSNNKINNNYIHPSVHGFVKKRGILSNAYAHINKNKIICTDISEFFKSINTKDVFNVFLKLGLTRNGAELFSKLCTINGVLEEGLHTSPLLANLHCYELDVEFSKLAQKHNATYTRYADDITISSDNYLPKLKSIIKVLNKYKFSINENKTRFRAKGQAQYVTGLSISNKTRPRLPRLTKKRLRMEFFYIEKYGLISHLEKSGSDDELGKEINRLQGWVQFLNHVEPLLSKKYMKIFAASLEEILSGRSEKSHE